MAAGSVRRCFVLSLVFYMLLFQITVTKFLKSKMTVFSTSLTRIFASFLCWENWFGLRLSTRICHHAIWKNSSKHFSIHQIISTPLLFIWNTILLINFLHTLSRIRRVMFLICIWIFLFVTTFFLKKLHLRLALKNCLKIAKFHFLGYTVYVISW